MGGKAEGAQGTKCLDMGEGKNPSVTKKQELSTEKGDQKGHSACIPFKHGAVQRTKLVLHLNLHQYTLASAAIKAVKSFSNVPINCIQLFPTRIGILITVG